MDRLEAFRIGRLDAHDQAALLRSGQVSARDLIDAAITRIELLDPALNSVTFRADVAARSRAAQLSGPGVGMQGVPYLLKESLDYPGMPNRSGSRAGKRDAYAGPGYEFTRRLDAAGLIPVGKTNMPEFGLMPTTESLLHGAARNPWNPRHSAGGSSGGAAVAVAAGMVPLAHAADGGGSIRIPASSCGVFGLKPSRGTNARARVQHFVEDLLVSDTLLSRSVRDVAWATGITRSGQPGFMDLRIPQHRLRIGFLLTNLLGDAPHPQVAEVICKTAGLCAALGHNVEDVCLPLDGAAISTCFQTIWGYLAREIVGLYRDKDSDGAAMIALEPWTLNLAAWGEQLPVTRLGEVFDQVGPAASAMSRFFGTYDILLSPVVKEPPIEIGRMAPDLEFESTFRDFFDYVSYSPLQNLTGVPAMSVPLYATPEGLPVGSMFTAARGAEDLLLQLAFELEQAEPWAQRWPPHSVGAD